MWLVFGGVGSAVIGGSAIGEVGIALAFGLVVLTTVYAVGHVSGAHMNPAVSVGRYVAGRFSLHELCGYVSAQLVGAIAGAALVLAIEKGRPGGYQVSVRGLYANGYDAHSPSGFSLAACFLAESLFTFFFLFIGLGVTSARSPTTFSGVARGLSNMLVHLVGIPITGGSVNPARSTGSAVFVRGWAIDQLWLFWVAPLLGAAAAGLVSRWLDPEDVARPRSPFRQRSRARRLDQHDPGKAEGRGEDDVV